MLVYKKWLLTFLKSFGQEIKKKKKKLRQNSATVWPRKDWLHTVRIHRKDPKSESYALIETEVWDIYRYIMPKY